MNHFLSHVFTIFNMLVNSESLNEEEQEEEEEKSTNSEDEGELEYDEPDHDPWRPLRKEVGKDIEEPYMKQVQCFMDKGKNQTFAEDAAFNTLL